MPQTPKNTDYDKRNPTPNIKGVMDSHKKLFGTGAKVSAPVRIVDQYGSPSLDEQAWTSRPKADNAGKDINLPAAPKKAAPPTRKKSAAKPLSPSKKR